VTTALLTHISARECGQPIRVERYHFSEWAHITRFSNPQPEASPAGSEAALTASESSAWWACDLGKWCHCESLGVHLGCRHVI
jgi:hypothetical protein